MGANKQAVKIIGDHTDLMPRPILAYDPKKSGGLTQSICVSLQGTNPIPLPDHQGQLHCLATWAEHLRS